MARRPNRDINTPSTQELIAAFGQPRPQNQVDFVESGIRGLDLQNTVLKRKQEQEDRVAALKAKIEQAKKQRMLAEQIGAEDPTAGLAAQVDGQQASKQKLEQYFTERAAKAPKTPSYSKVGETADEIILADLTDPTRQHRIKAPGVGAKTAGRGDPALALQTEKDRAKVIIGKAQKALGQVGPFTTGKGSAIADIPFFGRGSEAKNLQGTVDTIKANLGFEQLAKMRQASPTGGALGQIAVKELEFLQAAVSNLNTDQGEDQVRENVKEVIARYTNWLDTTEGRAPSYPNGAADVPDSTPAAGAAPNVDVNALGTALGLPRKR